MLRKQQQWHCWLQRRSDFVQATMAAAACLRGAASCRPVCRYDPPVACAAVRVAQPRAAACCAGIVALWFLHTPCEYTGHVTAKIIERSLRSWAGPPWDQGQAYQVSNVVASSDVLVMARAAPARWLSLLSIYTLAVLQRTPFEWPLQLP